MNQFVRQATMGAGSCYTENGALSYASIGSALLDQFAKAGAARGRDLTTVFAEQSALWAENPDYALKFPFYLRMVTRKAVVDDDNTTEAVQRGSGAKDEAFKRLIWIALYHPESFYKNLWLLPVVGSWKDLWVMLTMEDKLNKEKFFETIAAGINSDYHRELVKKYLPQIRANSKCKTEWAKKTNQLAKEFCAFAGWTPKEYREFKTTGRAHEFQRVICAGQYDKLNFKTIPGKALLNLVSGKFLEKHDLTNKYINWLESQPVAKFNGYPYELVMKLNGYRYNLTSLPLATKVTIDKQFDNLIATAKDGDGGIKGNVWCALDTSGSMTSPIARDSKVTSFDVCIGLGIYFATLNEGAFHKNVIMFDSTSTVKQLKGSFTDMYQQIVSDRVAWGSTNFMSIIELICKIRRENPQIPLEEYCTTLLVVSDMQMNSCGSQTNYEAAKAMLRGEFPEEWVENVKFIWWEVNQRAKDFPSNMDCGGCYNIGGFDGSIVSLILGGQAKVVDEVTGEERTPTMDEVIDAALNQEVLKQVTL